MLHRMLCCLPGDSCGRTMCVLGRQEGVVRGEGGGGGETGGGCEGKEANGGGHTGRHRSSTLPLPDLKLTNDNF